MRKVTRDELLAQHDRIRVLLAEACRCGAHAEETLYAQQAFEAIVESLRDVVEAHNLLEEVLLAPVLAAQAGPGALRARRMFDEHRQEHTLLRKTLARLPTSLARDMPAIAEMLEAHMLAEERTFLSEQALTPRGTGPARAVRYR